MGWGEFCSLLSGIDADTPLGRVVLIRAETDQEKSGSFLRMSGESTTLGEIRKPKSNSAGKCRGCGAIPADVCGNGR